MLLRNARLPGGQLSDIRIEGETIVAIDSGLDGSPTVDLAGRQVLPGAIDVHVHFREPGATHKESWQSGTQAAAAGGVTTVIDQPNTTPATVDASSFHAKATAARRSAIVDYGINGGVSPSWRPEELFELPITALGEVFMADSTGEMGIDDEQFVEALELAADAGVVVTVHAEDASKFDESVRNRGDPAAWAAYRPPAAEIAATERAIEAAEATGASIHLAHASTPEAVELIATAGMTCEVTPHHLLCSIQDLDRLGTRGRMNPPLRSEAHRQAMLAHLQAGRIDMVATDHAPHTCREKDNDIWSAPSGVPGVETMLPLLSALTARGMLSFDDIAQITARAPARRFSLENKGRLRPGADADIVVLSGAGPRRIGDRRPVTACGWTPFENQLGHSPILTFLRGKIAYHDLLSGLSLPAQLQRGTFGPPRGRNVRQTRG